MKEEGQGEGGGGFFNEFKRNLKFIESYYIAIYKVLSVHCYV